RRAKSATPEGSAGAPWGCCVVSGVSAVLKDGTHSVSASTTVNTMPMPSARVLIPHLSAAGAPGCMRLFGPVDVRLFHQRLSDRWLSPERRQLDHFISRVRSGVVRWSIASAIRTLPREVVD